MSKAWTRFVWLAQVTLHEMSTMSVVPGIGKITAFTIFLEIDGIERFESDKQFLSYCRLVPGSKLLTLKSQADGLKDP